MGKVRSRDGTEIAYERNGDGPALVIVDGALCYRELGPSKGLAGALSDRYAVYTYDRRGRGESGDTPPYAVEREVEDLAAVVEAAGGSAAVYGVSSGAALAIEAAARGVPVERLALYETPFVVSADGPAEDPDYLPRLEAALAADRRADAVRLFMRQVGVPRLMLALMPLLPAWSKMEAVAHTLPYDHALVAERRAGEPLAPEPWAAATAPTLALAGGKSPAWMRAAMDAVAAALPNAERRDIPGQSHIVKPKAHAPVLDEFLAASAATGPATAPA